jgi:DNA-binding NtrC family response regulator
MAHRDELERYEATEAQDLTRLLRGLQSSPREVQVPPPVDLAVRAAIWKAQVRRQVTALLAMPHRDLIRLIRQALTENPLLEEVVSAEDEDAPAGQADALRLTTAAADLTDAAERYDSLWQACMVEGWDADALPSQAAEVSGVFAHASGSSEGLVPDVMVVKGEQEYRVVLNEAGMPRLRVRASAQPLAREGQRDASETMPDLDDRLRAAVWLSRSLEYRRRTLTAVAQHLVTRQRAFLDHGLAHLQPLALTAVAEAVGLHASTVRLILANTYLSTADGIIALTAFFPRGVASSTGEPRSSLMVKDRINKLVAAEDPAKPLTDQQLVEMLAAEQITIARRTVTEYRRELQLPPAYRRQSHGFTAGTSRLSPAEEQRVRQILEAPASLAAYQAWLESRPTMPDPVGEMRTAYRDLQTALAHPQLRPAVLLALRAFAQAAQASTTSSPPDNPGEPELPVQERPDVQAHRRQGGSWIGESPTMREVSRLVERAQRTTASVLITGEPGTGKEWLARRIHAQGPRREGLFIVVRCAGIPEARLEAELFGEEVADGIGARQPQPGCATLAAGGTLFLDEIAALSPILQAKVLRMLQEKRFTRVGGTQTLTTDARIIGATTQNLDRLLAEGAFRSDLYYRLQVFPIALPPLRERREDILPLARHFLSRWSAAQGKNGRELSDDAGTLLCSYDWPGNVQELEAVMEEAVAQCHGSMLTSQDLPPALREPTRTPVWRGEATTWPPGGIAMADLEKRLIQQALEQAQGNTSHAAKMLGLSQTELRTRMRRYGLEDH